MSWLQSGWVMNASTADGSNDDIVNGLAMGHAYSITTFLQAGKHKLIKLQNPWHKVNSVGTSSVSLSVSDEYW